MPLPRINKKIRRNKDNLSNPLLKSQLFKIKMMITRKRNPKRRSLKKKSPNRRSQINQNKRRNLKNLTNPNNNKINREDSTTPQNQVIYKPEINHLVTIQAHGEILNEYKCIIEKFYYIYKILI